MLHAVSELLFQETKTFAEIITLEMGKLFRDSVAEIEKCARGCRFYAENGERFLEEEPAQTDAAESYVEYQPLGPVLAVMPWNFPFWQVFRFAAPALIAGNVGLLKHASNVSQCALAIEEIFCRAGFEEGVFQTLLIEPEQVEKIIADARVKAVTVTGSEKAGAAVASAAAREIKKSVLELGGSDAFIVMPSADFESALSTAVKARTINTGQSCIAAKRFIIADEIHEQFLQQFVERMRALKVGDPMDPETGARSTCDGTNPARRGRSGAENNRPRRKIINGRKPHHGPGFFYKPPFSSMCRKSRRHTAKKSSARLQLFSVWAMQTRLSSLRTIPDSAWVRARGPKIARNKNFSHPSWIAGMVFINAMVASDPRLPFGGVKRSGFGRRIRRGWTFASSRTRRRFGFPEKRGRRLHQLQETPPYEKETTYVGMENSGFDSVCARRQSHR